MVQAIRSPSTCDRPRPNLFCYTVYTHLVSIWLTEDICDCLLDTVDRICLLVWNLNAKLLLNRHHDLHGIQAVVLMGKQTSGGRSGGQLAWRERMTTAMPRG